MHPLRSYRIGQLAILAKEQTFWNRIPLDSNLDFFPGKDPPIVRMTERISFWHCFISSSLLQSLRISVLGHLQLNEPKRRRRSIGIMQYYKSLLLGCFDLPFLTALFSTGITFSPLTHRLILIVNILMFLAYN
jgi:hypothetical protein